MARPLISTLFPQLARFVQPLSGEYAGRRDVLETLPFVEGWGVEFALLVDVVERFGIASTAQVDLGVREHRNRPLARARRRRRPRSSSPRCAARAWSSDRARTRPSSLRFTDDFEPEAVAVEVRERPPIETVPAYRKKHGHELTA